MSVERRSSRLDQSPPTIESRIASPTTSPRTATSVASRSIASAATSCAERTRSFLDGSTSPMSASQLDKPDRRRGSSVGRPSIRTKRRPSCSSRVSIVASSRLRCFGIPDGIAARSHVQTVSPDPGCNLTELPVGQAGCRPRPLSRGSLLHDESARTPQGWRKNVRSPRSAQGPHARLQELPSQTCRLRHPRESTTTVAAMRKRVLAAEFVSTLILGVRVE